MQSFLRLIFKLAYYNNWLIMVLIGKIQNPPRAAMVAGAVPKDPPHAA
jgi:hypothetical protein